MVYSFVNFFSSHIDLSSQYLALIASVAHSAR